METVGKMTGLSVAYPSRKAVITLEVTARPEDIEKYTGQDLDITIDKHRNHRSVNANKLLWECIRRIAMETGRDKWTEYLELLRDYGKYTYLVAKPEAVEAVKRQWRETEVLGKISVNGTEAVQMLCYFGSSTYNTKEFAALLDGAINQMRCLGLDVPPSGDVKRALDRWEAEHGKE